MRYQYAFVEKWTLGASPEAVFRALADFELWPRWGYPCYLEGTRQGKPGVVGTTGSVLVRGGLPVKVTMNLQITRVVPGRELELAISGDLEGFAIKSVRPMPGGTTELLSDMCCNPRLPWVRALTPVLRRMFCWNHEQAINAGYAGLARYLGDAGSKEPAGRQRHAAV